MFLFPDADNSKDVAPAGASVAVAIKRGQLYMVVADGAAYLNYSVAASKKNIYIPPNFPMYFVFGMADSQGTNLDLRCFAAAGVTVFFTPVYRVPAAQ